MSDWIKKQADLIKKQEQAEAKEREWQIHKRQLVSEQWESAWRAVQMATRRQVEVFNAQFQGEPNKHIAMTDERDFGFMLQHEHAHVTRVVQVSGALAGIHLRIIVTERGSADRRMGADDLRWGATTEGDVGVASNGGIKTSDKAAESILQHLF